MTPDQKINPGEKKNTPAEEKTFTRKRLPMRKKLHGLKRNTDENISDVKKDF
jgi:hypothetical protein